jgi:hypothetical protein
MTNLPPALVLALRLEHSLGTARFYATAGDAEGALGHIEKAQATLAQLLEAMR